MDKKNENEKMVVAYISPGWPLQSFPNGIVAYIENLISGCDGVFQPYVITNNVTQGEWQGVIDVSQYGKKNILDSILYRCGGRYVEEIQQRRRKLDFSNRIIKGIDSLDRQPDIMEVEESFGFAFELLKCVKMPVVTRLHGPWFTMESILYLDDANGDMKRVADEGLAIKASHGVSAPSLDVLERVRNYYNCDLPDAKVIPNPVLPVSELGQWRHRRDARQSILMVGRFDLPKGGDLALNAFRIIASQNKDVELLFVGPDRGLVLGGREYSFSEYLSAFIPESEIKKRIHFMGHCSHDEIAGLRKNSTVTIVTSRYETFSISLAEALAVGSPVVAINVGAIGELVKDGFNGLLVDMKDPEECMAAKVLMLLDDLKLMRKLSRNAVKDCNERFSPEVIAEQTREFYATIIEKHLQL